MLEYDPNDYDLIQAREDNLNIINKRIEILSNLQNKLKNLCPSHPFVVKDIFEILSLIENNMDNPEKIINSILTENKPKMTEEETKQNSNQNDENKEEVEIISNVIKKNEILREVDL